MLRFTILYLTFSTCFLLNIRVFLIGFSATTTISALARQIFCTCKLTLRNLSKFWLCFCIFLLLSCRKEAVSSKGGSDDVVVAARSHVGIDQTDKHCTEPLTREGSSANRDTGLYSGILTLAKVVSRTSLRTNCDCIYVQCLAELFMYLLTSWQQLLEVETCCKRPSYLAGRLLQLRLVKWLSSRN